MPGPTTAQAPANDKYVEPQTKTINRKHAFSTAEVMSVERGEIKTLFASRQVRIGVIDQRDWQAAIDALRSTVEDGEYYHRERYKALKAQIRQMRRTLKQTLRDTKKGLAARTTMDKTDGSTDDDNEKALRARYIQIAQVAQGSTRTPLIVPVDKYAIKPMLQELKDIESELNEQRRDESYPLRAYWRPAVATAVIDIVVYSFTQSFGHLFSTTGNDLIDAGMVGVGIVTFGIERLAQGSHDRRETVMAFRADRDALVRRYNDENSVGVLANAPTPPAPASAATSKSTVRVVPAKAPAAPAAAPAGTANAASTTAGQSSGVDSVAIESILPPPDEGEVSQAVVAEEEGKEAAAEAKKAPAQPAPQPAPKRTTRGTQQYSQAYLAANPDLTL